MKKLEISATERTAIKNLISEKEATSACEIVPMIVEASAAYPAAHFRLAIVVSFIFSLVLYYSPLTLLNPIYFLWIQVPGLIAGYLLGNIPSLKRMFISRHEMNLKVSQHAYESFMHHNLHMTKNHNGLLIFISRFERKIKIIADNGIKSKIDNHTWDNVVANFIKIIKNENIVVALKATIQSTGEILGKNFPATEARTNELENDLILE
jgi:putative membrane protein